MAQLAFPPHKASRLFLSHVPAGFLRGSLRLLFNVYRTACAECSERHPPPECHDLLPHFRRALLEAAWRELAGRTEGVDAYTAGNAGRRSFHTVIRSGSVLLTASAVDAPKRLVRPAEFRQTYARSNQLYLFDHPLPPSPDADLYAILIHGPSDDMFRLGFAHVVFPAPECDRYLGRIDLFRCLGDVVDGYGELREEVIPDALELRLRVTQREAEGL